LEKNCDFTLAVHTNNGVEAQNRSFKFEYLEPYHHKALSNLLDCIVNRFLPDASSTDFCQMRIASQVDIIEKYQNGW